MKGWQIFTHSVRLVLGNKMVAMQIALVPMMLVFGAMVVVVGGIAAMSGGNPSLYGMAVSGSAVILFILVWIGMMIVSLWVVTSWHRFVLLGEYPTGWIPPFRFDRIMAYFGRILLLMLLGIVAMFPMIVLASLFSVGVDESGSVIFSVLLVPYALAIGVLMYRFVAILPAAAIGQPLTLAQSWNATMGATATIVVLMIVFVVVQLLLQLIASFLMAFLPIVGFPFYLAVTVVMGLVGISILTTFYGHYVEGRDLS